MKNLGLRDDSEGIIRAARLLSAHSGLTQVFFLKSVPERPLCALYLYTWLGFILLDAKVTFLTATVFISFETIGSFIFSSLEAEVSVSSLLGTPPLPG